ncbi:MAG TPA: D-glycero-beta-D-manno-heptose-7-phosphate kinase [Elusimicrobia bacterium]|nr:D-glycero-beta-D-manno-heptose-7-phosphate kinase [Elusimicrobiota bacterium]HBT60936.1 D-glycero-beta-D-manno-heptose-7-phosphate kinase [Elusimicrobiota bacterium]
MPKTRADKLRLQRFIARFPKTRILVVGDIMLDQFIRGTVSRISPEAPVPVVQVRGESFVPGGAGNVAHNLGALGARVEIVSVAGDDPAGRRLSDDFSAQRIETGRIVIDPQRVTSQKCRVIAEHQQVVRYDRETPQPLSKDVENGVINSITAALPDAQGVILSDYGKGVITPRILKTTIAHARRRGIPVTVDPKVEHFGLYRGVDCITPNTAEAWAGMGLPPQSGEKPLTELGWAIRRRLLARSVLITRGPDGMSLFEPDGRLTHIPTRAREVFDVTGAGDTVISVLTLSLAVGADIRDAAYISNYAAGIVVGKLGTAVATMAELREALCAREG